MQAVVLGWIAYSHCFARRTQKCLWRPWLLSARMIKVPTGFWYAVLRCMMSMSSFHEGLVFLVTGCSWNEPNLSKQNKLRIVFSSYCDGIDTRSTSACLYFFFSIHCEFTSLRVFLLACCWKLWLPRWQTGNRSAQGKLSNRGSWEWVRCSLS